MAARKAAAVAKVPARTSATKKTTPNGSTTPDRTTAAAKKSTAQKATAKKAPTKKATAKKAQTKKAAAPTKRTMATKKVPTAKRAPATRTTTAPAAKKAAVKKTTTVLSVRPNEKPWTEAELDDVRAEIEDDIIQLEHEIRETQAELVGLMRDSGDGAGDDQADAGTKTYEREQEMTVANNARELLLQNELALERMADGSYGTCESCGNPIGKLRLQAAPRATLCLDCKKKQERR